MSSFHVVVEFKCGHKRTNFFEVGPETDAVDGCGQEGDVPLHRCVKR